MYSASTFGFSALFGRQSRGLSAILSASIPLAAVFLTLPAASLRAQNQDYWNGSQNNIWENQQLYSNWEDSGGNPVNYFDPDDVFFQNPAPSGLIPPTTVDFAGNAVHPDSVTISSSYNFIDSMGGGGIVEDDLDGINTQQLNITINNAAMVSFASANAYTGQTTITQNSTLQINNDAALGTQTNNLTQIGYAPLAAYPAAVSVDAGSPLDLNGHVLIVGGLLGQGTVTTTAANAQLLVAFGSPFGGDGAVYGNYPINPQFTGLLSGSLALHVTLGDANQQYGDGTIRFIFTLGGASPNTYSGGTTVDGNYLANNYLVELQFGGNQPLGTGGLTVGNAFVDTNGFSQSLPSLSDGMDGIGTIFNSTNTLSTLTLNSATSTFSGAIQGSIAMVINGGSPTLSGNSVYSGGTSITGAGRLQADSPNALGVGSVTIDANSFLDLSGSGNVVVHGLVNGAGGGGTIGTSSTGGNPHTLVISIGSGNTNSFSGTIKDGISGGTDHLGLTVTGGGIMVLSGANTFSGGTTITGGATARLGSASPWGPATVSIDANSFLDMGGTSSATVAGLFDGASGGGTIGTSSATSSTRTLTTSVGVGNTDSFSGTIQDGISGGTDNVALVVAGAGTQVLSGASSYSGGTTVGSGTSGTLRVNNSSGSATGTALVTVANHGTLSGSTLPGLGAISGAVAVNSGGTIAYSGASLTPQRRPVALRRQPVELRPFRSSGRRRHD